MYILSHAAGDRKNLLVSLDRSSAGRTTTLQDEELTTHKEIEVSFVNVDFLLSPWQQSKQSDFRLSKDKNLLLIKLNEKKEYH